MNQTTLSTVRSMTGQGHATLQSELGTVTVEVRTINSRGFKFSPRLSDSLASLDGRIGALARSLIRRGTVHLSVSWRRPFGENRPNIDTDVLGVYYQQLRKVRDSVDDANVSIDLSSLMTLPGVIVAAREDRTDDDEIWNFVRQVIAAAFENLNQMRGIEGAAMAETLSADCLQISQRLDQIATLAPRAVDTYRNRLETKIQRLLAAHEIEVPKIDLLREVQIYADRADISEEITRLSSHLKMFVSILSGDNNDSSSQPEPTGRKLDFVIQEMFRETNTIGSKAADAEVSAQVVEIKCAIERMRELVQNLE